MRLIFYFHSYIFLNPGQTRTSTEATLVSISHSRDFSVCSGEIPTSNVHISVPQSSSSSAQVQTNVPRNYTPGSSPQSMTYQALMY